MVGQYAGQARSRGQSQLRLANQNTWQWLAQIFRDLQVARYIGKNANLVEMRGDNQGALALVKNPHLHERSKHIDICYHFIRDLAEKGKLNVEFIPTTEMVADGMTKPLQRVAFERFKAQLGVVN
jgi:hypothetical protein